MHFYSALTFVKFQAEPVTGSPAELARTQNFMQQQTLIRSLSTTDDNRVSAPLNQNQVRARPHVYLWRPFI